MEKEKPYGCERCGKRYKNLNGLKYHKAHSPLCNPGGAASTGGKVGASDLAAAAASAANSPTATTITTSSTENLSYQNEISSREGSLGISSAESKGNFGRGGANASLHECHAPQRPPHPALAPAPYKLEPLAVHYGDLGGLSYAAHAPAATGTGSGGSRMQQTEHNVSSMGGGRSNDAVGTANSGAGDMTMVAVKQEQPGGQQEQHRQQQQQRAIGVLI
jgi:hypothetical protein